MRRTIDPEPSLAPNPKRWWRSSWRDDDTELCVCVCGGREGVKIWFYHTLPFFVSSFFFYVLSWCYRIPKYCTGDKNRKKKGHVILSENATSMATPSILCQVVSEGWSFQKKNMEKYCYVKIIGLGCAQHALQRLRKRLRLRIEMQKSGV